MTTLSTVCYLASFSTHEEGRWWFYLANQAVTWLLWAAVRRARWRRLLLIWPFELVAGLLIAAFAAPDSARLCVGVIVMAFLFVGLTQPRWTSPVLLPFAEATFLVVWRSLPHGQEALRSALALLTWLAVAEFPAWLTTNLRNARREVAALALTDSLTGLPNRRAWDQRLAQLHHDGVGADPVSVLLIDLDHFKRYNDEHGHLGGDGLLVEFANALRSQVRRQDVVARWGGEEFAVLLDSASPAEAQAVAARILSAVPRAQSCSIGVATRLPGERHPSLMERADRALYRAKAGGRSRVATAERPAS